MEHAKALHGVVHPRPLPGVLKAAPMAGGLAEQRSSQALVIHLVGRVTEAVLSFLGPAVHAIAESGTPQVVVAIDDAASRDMVPRLPTSVDVMLVHDHANPVRRWSRLHGLVRSVIRRRSVAAVHLHGFLPSLLGALVVRRRGIPRIPLYFSPHASRTLVGSMRFVGAPLVWMLRPLSALSDQVGIANVESDARKLSALTGEAIELVESPVSDTFFDAQRHESRRPLLLSSGAARGGNSVDLFIQLAVMLGDSGLDLSFNWVGEVDLPVQQRLKAANVGLFSGRDDADRASRLAGGWIYVAVGGGRGFPMALAEAMAAGVAIVALDTATHRDLLDDGRTGFVCKTHHDMLIRIAELIDDPALRHRLGDAAREDAQRRFSPRAFSRNLMAAYERGDFVTEPMAFDPLKES